MNELSWLTDYRFQSLARRDYDWVFAFDQSVSLVVACLWRLLEDGHIRLTSEDDGQQFGLPAPVNAVPEVNERLTGAKIEVIVLNPKTLDLDFHFSTGHVLQVLPDSAGYESWNLNGNGQQFVAVGGGNLAIFGGKATNC